MGFKSNHHNDFNILIRNKELYKSSCVKVLYALVDEKFSWSDHVDFLLNELSPNLIILKMISILGSKQLS